MVLKYFLFEKVLKADIISGKKKIEKRAGERSDGES